jgi:Zinc finger, C2H2 type
MAKAATKEAGTGADAALVCPECGKTFTRPASLGAHRKMTHGVAGTSKAASTTRTRKPKTAARSGRRAEVAGVDGAGKGVDRDALLRTLFPEGIPPRQEVVSAVSDWLNEAERLARSR